MKAARLHAFTENPADIVIEDVPVSEPGPGQVRVRMKLAPVNPSDLNFVRGTYYAALERMIWNAGGQGVFFDPQRRTPHVLPPYTLGLEGMGVVDASGSGFMARRLRGRRVAVIGMPPNGTWQESVVVDARKALVLPDGIPDEQGAMYLANPITAYLLVREVLKVPRGGSLLLTAAGSALGKSIVRLGRRDGFRTLCVVRSSAHTSELESLGAEAVIETDRQDLIAEVARITAGQGVGYALDCVGGELAGQSIRCLGTGGHLVVYGTLANSPMQLPSRDLMMPGARVTGFLLSTWTQQQSPLKLLGVLRAVRRLALQGAFHADVGEIFPLAQAPAAVAAAIRPGRTGKVLLRIAD